MFVQKQNFGVNDRLQFNFQRNTYDYPAHIHQFAELCYMINGTLEVTVNDRTLTLYAGDHLFIAPLQVHSYSTPERCDAVVMAFPTSLLPEAAAINSFARGGRADSPDAAGYFESLFVRGGLGTPAFAPADNDRPNHTSFYIDLADQRQFIRVRSALGALLAECAENPDEPTGDTDALAKLLNWLGGHFTEPVTLSGAAQALGYSRNYLSHRVKRLSGMTFPELLANLRVEHALGLLGKMTVLDAALESGFETERSFYRAFKKITGCTPGEYLKGKNQ